MPLSLKRLKSFHGRKGPLLLIIMDGIGIGKQDSRIRGVEDYLKRTAEYRTRNNEYRRT
jgi:hypothetical protein